VTKDKILNFGNIVFIDIILTLEYERVALAKFVLQMLNAAKALELTVDHDA
jgi:hypothetical protein